MTIPLTGSRFPEPLGTSGNHSDFDRFPVPGVGNRNRGTGQPVPGESKIKIIISSRDQTALPLVAGAARLADLARTAGWYVRVGYAVAEVSERWYLNGNLDRAAHQIQTVMVGILRPPAVGRALWELCSDRPTGWRFAHAFLGVEKLNLAELVERIKT
jgi:hypothetical protein